MFFRDAPAKDFKDEVADTAKDAGGWFSDQLPDIEDGSFVDMTAKFTAAMYKMW